MGKEKWKTFGKSTGQAFKNFGKAMATTAKVVVGKEKNDEEENGKSKLKNAWTKTGKGFGKAGSNLGKAAAGTFQSDEPSKEGVDKDGAVDVEVKEEKTEDNVKQIEKKEE